MNMEGEPTSTDLVVETEGHCFLCLEPPQLIPTQSTLKFMTPSIYSLECLSRYLKLDVKKLLYSNNETMEITSDSTEEQLERSRLKASLCEDCANLSKTFSGLYHQLEKIKMEVNLHLSLIHRKMEKANETHKAQLFSNLTTAAVANIQSSVGHIAKLKIAEELRTAASEKCSQRLALARPHIKLENLTETEVIPETAKFIPSNSSSLNDPDDFTEVKQEINDATEEDECQFPNLFSFCDEDNVPQEQPISSSLSSVMEDNTGSRTRLESDLQTSCVPSTSQASKTEMKICSSLNPETGKYRCSLCPKEFVKNRMCQIHYESFHLKLRHTCPACGKQFNRKASYDLHYQSVHEGIKHQCEYCSEMFSLKSNLQQHQKLKHRDPNQELTFKCHFCEKAFANSIYRNRHMKKCSITSRHGNTAE